MERRLDEELYQRFDLLVAQDAALLLRKGWHQCAVYSVGDVLPPVSGIARYGPIMADVPLYERVRQAISSSIADGTYESGDRLPSEFRLAGDQSP